MKLEVMLSTGGGADGVVRRKGLMMGGFFRIVLGGAVGAALGILFMKKQTVRKPGERAGMPAARPVPPPVSPAVAPAPPVAAAVQVAEPSPIEAAAPLAAAAVVPAAPAVAPEPVSIAPAMAAAAVTAAVVADEAQPEEAPPAPLVEAEPAPVVAAVVVAEAAEAEAPAPVAAPVAAEVAPIAAVAPAAELEAVPPLAAAVAPEAAEAEAPAPEPEPAAELEAVPVALAEPEPPVALPESEPPVYTTLEPAAEAPVSAWAAPPVAAATAPAPVPLVAPEAPAPEVYVPEPYVAQPATEVAPVIPASEVAPVIPAAAVAAAVTAAAVAGAEAEPDVASPAPVAPVAEPVEESHPGIWAIAGLAAAGLVHARSEDKEEPPAVPAAAVAAAGVVATGAIDTEASVPPAPPVEAPAPPELQYTDHVPAFAERPTTPEAEAEIGEVAVPEAPESVVLVTPEVLEEPLPGAGWEPSAVFVQEEVELEELLPVVADDMPPYEEQPPVEEAESRVEDEWDITDWPEIAVAATKEPEPETVAMAGSATEEAETYAGLPEVEAPVAEWQEVSPLAPLAVGQPAAGREQPAAEELQSEYQPPVFAEAATEAAVGDDLKSRIEETRRRIREELEKPFAAVDEPPAQDTPVRPAVVAAGVAAAAPEPVIGEAMSASPVPVHAPGGNGSSPITAAEEAAASDTSDYDAMRARIEQTRSRLKAKAFDAMMAGESALLGRDAEGQGPARPTVAFDSEIEKTVDSTLKEEEQ